MTDKEQSQKAKEFAEFWKDKGYEKGQSQTFWLQLLSDVFGIEKPSEFIEFEDQVHIDKNTGFIDGYIPSTKVLIEQKSIDKDLRKGIRQSDGSLLTPFQQAKKYIAELPLSRHPKYVITCNFKSFLVYNMENPNREPEEILLENLEKEYYRLQFLVDTGNEHLKREMEISIQAGELVGKLYDEILKLYINPENEETLKSLNMFCVRLVFCLYAEDSGIFGKRLMFHDYLSRFEARDLRRSLIDLFKVLDTKIENRDPYMSEELAQFPYVNGGLFADENIEIPNLNDIVKELLLSKASENFDWSEISPTIFGAVFESTLNPETRRKGGMHYTSIENIHKVIDPLFLDELKEELQEIKQISVITTKKKKLEKFQNKLASLKFLDPACGSGNFLTETYLSLRNLENEVIFELTGGQIGIGDESFSPIKVSIRQFYGIEINDFAVTVAKTALWIAESQMMKETENILHINLDFLPLKSYTNITEGNALRIDWNDVIPKEELNYIMGNPPFVGQQLRTKEQSDDMISIFGKGSSETKLDYVLCWYKKAIKYMNNKDIKVAFVSTSSICQGESVPTFWRNFVEKDNAEIQFAHTSFEWKSEASEKAMVYCVIIGFTNKHLTSEKKIYSNGQEKKVDFINAYLISAPNIWIVNRSNNNFYGLPKMTKGSEPTDGGNLFISAEEKKELELKYPILKQYIKPFIGGTEFLNNKFGEYTRYCLYFKNGNPSDYTNIREVSDRLKNIKEIRKNSSADRIRNMSNYPYLFCQDRQPESDYLVFPQHTTSKRKYIPIGFMPKDIIVGNACYMVPNISLYEFGVLTSNVHMAWTKVVCGRLGEGYRYSPAIYNNFPWCKQTEEQKKKIEKTAQAILNARALYPNSSLADLYDELTMPKELRKAHQENDKAVMEAYGFNWKKMTESDCVAELMKMYENLIRDDKNERK